MIQGVFNRTARRAVIPLFLLGLALSAPMAGAPSLAHAQTSARPEPYLFTFQDAEIAKVAQEVLDSVNAPYAIDPAVTGRMSLRIDQRLTKPQLIQALDTALTAYGVTMVRENDRLFITPMAKARSSASVRPYQEGAKRLGYEIVAVPLSYAQPSEVAKAIETIAGKDLLLVPYDRLGLMVMGGGGQDLNSALETMKVFDQDVFADSKVRWFPLNQASAVTVAGELDRLVLGSGAAGVSIVPMKRLNGVMVFARSTSVLDQLRKWVTQLDIPDSQTASSLWVYHPRHTNAEALARTLSAIMSADRRGADDNQGSSSLATSSVANASSGSDRKTNGVGPAEGASTVSDTSGRITVDKESNTLFITGGSSEWMKAQRVLAEIDRLPSQVLVEASIVEVTLGNDFRFGVDWSLLSGDFNITSVNNKTGAVAPSYPGASVTFLHGNIQAAVNALGSVATIQVVSAPKIIVLDNKTARIQVGDQVPTVSQSQQSTSTGGAPVLNSIDYRSTGVVLSVTPRISGEDRISLEVSQEVSSVAKTSSSTIDSPTIQQRKFESALTLQSGGVVALGGLISSNFSESRSGVPGLKSIPFVGGLFSSSGHNLSRTELIVLMSAKILRDEPSTSAAMTDLYQDMNELQRRGLLPRH
jgi:general secretion pathway protein D